MSKWLKLFQRLKKSEKYYMWVSSDPHVDVMDVLSASRKWHSVANHLVRSSKTVRELERARKHLPADSDAKMLADRKIEKLSKGRN